MSRVVGLQFVIEHIGRTTKRMYVPKVDVYRSLGEHLHGGRFVILVRKDIEEETGMPEGVRPKMDVDSMNLPSCDKRRQANYRDS